MPSSADAPRARCPQEVDAWYGSFSPRAMLPELVWFLALTILLVVLALLLPARNLARMGIILLLALVWLVQLLIGLYGLFAYNYRLTNHRLFKEKSLLVHDFEQLELAEITNVRVDRGGFGGKLRVGNIVAVTGAGKSMILEGVRDPELVQQHINEMRRLARERPKG